MKNRSVVTQGLFVSQTINPNSSSSTASGSYFDFLSQSGYTGPVSSVRPLPPNPYTLLVQKCSAFHEYRRNKGSRTAFGSGPILRPGPGGNFVVFEDDSDPSQKARDDALYNEALLRLSGEIRGDLDVSVDFAEAHKTAKMFDVVSKVEDYTKVFRRKYGLLKSASNAWLEYTYGVKPLLSTIHGLAEENTRVVLNKIGRHRASASTVYTPRTVTVNTIFGPLVNPIRVSHLKRSFSLGVALYNDQVDFARFSSLNPLSIAWELTPYSFVVDWFLNVGGYLRSYETALLYSNKFLHGYKTILTAGDVSWDWGRGQFLPGWNIELDRFYGQAHVVSISRTGLGSIPTPRLPSFKANLGSNRLISSAALLARLLR